jgi:hypothetical protein
MMSPPVVIAWTLWRRHRWGLSAAAATTAVVLIVAALVRSTLSPGEALARSAIGFMPLLIIAFYVIAVFSYGFDMDVAGGGSCFPARQFTLPLRTADLAGWPIIYGAVAVGGLWLAAAGLLFRPAGLDIPLVWPAILAAAQVAWIQALLWWPFGLQWTRPIVGVALVHLPVTGMMVAQKLDVPESFFLVYSIACLPVAVAAAFVGVSRARGGVVPQWEWLSALGRATPQTTAKPFQSPLRAQMWFEWRRFGKTLPLLICLILPLALLGLFLEENTPPILARSLGLALGLTIFLAGMAGESVVKNNPWSRELYAISSFAATRPMTCAELVGAKFRAAAKTTLVSWVLVILLIAAALMFSGSHRVLGEMIDAWLAARPVGEVIATVAAVGAILVLLTWKRLIENLLIGMAGREWVHRVFIFIGVVFAISFLIAAMWFLIHPEYHERIRVVGPWLMAAAVALKLLTAALAIRALRRRRLVSDRTLAGFALAWIVIAATLFGLLRWVIPGEVVATTAIAMGIVLIMPLARLSAMPLALSWNRHR